MKNLRTKLNKISELLNTTNNAQALLIIVCLLTVFFFQFLIKPELITGRNNDLQAFKNEYSYVKKYILEDQHIPFWQNMVLGGQPYLGSPENRIVYILNYLNLLVPQDYFIIAFFFIHFCISAVGMFYLAKSYQLSTSSSIASAIIYGLSPKFIAHLEAGHINMIAAYSWIPICLYSLITLKKRPTLIHSLLLGFSLSAIFLNYITIFLYVLAICTTYFLLNIRTFLLKIRQLVPTIIIFLLIIAPQATVSLIYFPLSIRGLISIEDVGPNVQSTRHFIHSLFSPYTFGIENLSTETVLFLGFVPTALAFLGFFITKTKWKVIFLLTALITLLITFGTKTNVFIKMLELIPSLLIFRITTRIWFTVIIISSLLAGSALDRISGRKLLKLIIIVMIFIELIYFNATYFKIHQNILKDAPNSNNVFDSLFNKKDGFYRIYCTTSCNIKPFQYGKGLANGYNPVMLYNYYQLSQEFGGYKFNLYTLSIPPYQSYPDKPQPNSIEAGKLGIRYIISPYELTDKGFVLEQDLNNFLIYKNNNELPRAYVIANDTIEPVKVLKDLPGEVSLLLNGHSGTLVLNEPYMPFWEGKIDGKKESAHSASKLVGIPVNENSKIAEIKFNPPFSNITFPISVISATIILIILTIKFLKLLQHSLKNLML